MVMKPPESPNETTSSANTAALPVGSEPGQLDPTTERAVLYWARWLVPAIALALLILGFDNLSQASMSRAVADPLSLEHAPSAVQDSDLRFLARP